MGVPDERDAARELGAALRGYRITRGLSLRAMAKQVGLSGHGTLVDYEHGRRIPPEDLLAACERVLGDDDGRLRRLRLAALVERAEQQSALLLGERPPAPPAAPPAEAVPAEAPAARRTRPWWFRWPALATVLALVVAASVGAAVWPYGRHARSEANSTTLRMDFEDPRDHWTILWGSRRGTGQVTTALAYQGAHSYEVSVTGASERGYVAFGTTHGLETLHSGMRVTMHLWTSYPGNGVRFFVYRPGSVAVWAPETPGDGSEVPISGGTQWSTVTWTVPPVPKVTGIGIQPYAENDVPRVVAVDAVSW